MKEEKSWLIELKGLWPAKILKADRFQRSHAAHFRCSTGCGSGFNNKRSCKSLKRASGLTRPGCLQYLKGRTLTAYERDLERADRSRSIYRNPY